MQDKSAKDEEELSQLKLKRTVWFLLILFLQKCTSNNRTHNKVDGDNNEKTKKRGDAHSDKVRGAE